MKKINYDQEIKDLINIGMTGDVLHCYDRGFTAIIAIFTNFRRWLKGRPVARHTAILIKEMGGPMVYESTKHTNGWYPKPLDLWILQRKKFRISLINCEGFRPAIAAMSRSFIGYKYEKIKDMWKIPLNIKEETAHELFCTEGVNRVLKGVGLPGALNNPENIDPDEFDIYCENNLEIDREERIKYLKSHNRLPEDYK